MTFSEHSPPWPPNALAEDPFAPLIAAVERADSALLLLNSTRALADVLANRTQGGTEPPPPRSALTCLVRILGFNNPGAAVAAVDGLIACGPCAVPALLEGLDDHNYGARAWAVRALAGIGDVRGLEVLEQALAGDVGPSVRRAAAMGIGSLRVEPLAQAERRAVQERSLTALERARHDGEWVVRYSVATAMERLAFSLPVMDVGRGRALTTLGSLADILQEEVPVVRLRAQLGLTRLLAP
ncbi:MAG: HEAT repeat domain-containing protein [Cyanobacteriota bacterium]|jgi:phycocyanobilin lyase beta subunit